MSDNVRRMSIKDTIKTLDFVMGMDKQIKTPLLLGPPGLGKSQMVRQAASRNGYDTVIDIRLSQHDSTDVKGIPFKTEEEKLKWLAPDFIPIKGSKHEGKKGVLFFDELNRASHEVLQSVFEIVLDRSIGMEPILDNWFIVAAGNEGSSDGTFVTELDSALRDRFQIINVDRPTLNEWLDWAKENDIHETVRLFLEKFPRFLYFNEDDELITPRSWEKFSNIITNNKDVHPREISALMGNTLIGVANAEFHTFVQDFNNQVSAQDVLYNYENVKERIERIERHNIHSLNSQIITLLKQMDKNDYPTVIKNFTKYFKNNIDADNQVSLLIDIDSLDFLEAFFTENPEMNEEGSEMNKMISEALGS